MVAVEMTEFSDPEEDEPPPVDIVDIRPEEDASKLDSRWETFERVALELYNEDPPPPAAVPAEAAENSIPNEAKTERKKSVGLMLGKVKQSRRSRWGKCRV